MITAKAGVGSMNIKRVFKHMHRINKNPKILTDSKYNQKLLQMPIKAHFAVTMEYKDSVSG